MRRGGSRLTRPRWAAQTQGPPGLPPELPCEPHGERDAGPPHRPVCTGRQRLRPLRRGRLPRGRNGSGTIFFSLCNLRCVFCQNWDISQQSAGAECPPEQIAERCSRSSGAAATTSTSSPPSTSCPRSSRRSPRPSRAGWICRSSTTPAPTTRSSRCGCWTGSSTSTCPTSSSGSRRRPGGWPRRRTTRSGRARRSGRCTAGRRAAVRARRAGAARGAGAAPGHAGAVGRGRGDLRLAGRGTVADTYVNVMGQYRPEYEVGQIARDGTAKYAEIDRRP